MKKDKYFAVKLLGLIAILVCLILVVWICVEKIKEKLPEDSQVEQTTEETKEAESTVVEIQDVTQEDKLYEALTLALGKTQEQDYEKAFSLFEEAAALGNADAQYFAAEMYFQGLGVQQDTAKAAEYFSLAFQNGCLKAYDIYGKMLFLGEAGVSQDYEKAAAVLYTIAESNPQAAGTLGAMYTFGMGVPVNFDTANAFFTQAIKGGFEAAKVFQANIQDKLSGAEAKAAINKCSFADIRYSDKYTDLNELIAEYAGVLKETNHYDAFVQELTALQTMDINMATIITIFGKENWLFQQNPNDGNSYHDYIGDNAYTEEELASIAKHLQEQKELIEEAGSQFVLMILPNKEVVYSEYMPTYIERVSEVTRTDKLVDYLRKNTDITIIYMKDSYMANKEKYQLYYKTDTHCNMQGSFLAVAELINAGYNKEISLADTHFDIHMDNYCGDLGVMLGRQDRYATDSVYFMPETSALDEDKVEDSLLLIGDSFSEFINTQANYYFKGGVQHAMIMNHNYDFYQATKELLTEDAPDVVVWECVERYIDRLK